VRNALHMPNLVLETGWINRKWIKVNENKIKVEGVWLRIKVK